MANLEKPPLEKNGRKKGYTNMRCKRLWGAWIHKSKSARPGSKDRGKIIRREFAKYVKAGGTYGFEFGVTSYCYNYVSRK